MSELSPALAPNTTPGRTLGASPGLLRRTVGAMARFVRLSPVGTVGALIWLLLILMAIFAPVLAPYDPQEADYSAIRQPPSAAHWLSADDLGRDVLSRIIYGARITLVVSITSVLIGE